MMMSYGKEARAESAGSGQAAGVGLGCVGSEASSGLKAARVRGEGVGGGKYRRLPGKLRQQGRRVPEGPSLHSFSLSL